MTIREIKAPQVSGTTVRIFLAGAIDMGQAEKWQDRVVEKLRKFSDLTGVPIEIYNPRRDDWDSSWEQSVENKQFVQQVEWELVHLEKADLALFYFPESSKAPITLFELGYTLGRKSAAAITYCPKGYYRSGNVHFYHEVSGMPYFVDEDEWFDMIYRVIQTHYAEI